MIKALRWLAVPMLIFFSFETAEAAVKKLFPDSCVAQATVVQVRPACNPAKHPCTEDDLNPRPSTGNPCAATGGCEQDSTGQVGCECGPLDFFRSLFASAGIASSLKAQIVTPTGFASVDTLCKFASSGNPIIRIVNVVMRIIIGAILLIALITIVVGGYVYMTSGGSAERVGSAKTLIGSALIGLVLALIGYAILDFISPQFASQLQEPDPKNLDVEEFSGPPNDTGGGGTF
jgi:hypothetical protein